MNEGPGCFSYAGENAQAPAGEGEQASGRATEGSLWRPVSSEPRLGARADRPQRTTNLAVPGTRAQGHLFSAQRPPECSLHRGLKSNRLRKHKAGLSAPKRAPSFETAPERHNLKHLFLIMQILRPQELLTRSRSVIHEKGNCSVSRFTMQNALYVFSGRALSVDPEISNIFIVYDRYFRRFGKSLPLPSISD